MREEQRASFVIEALIFGALRDHSAVGKVVVAAARALTAFTVHKRADLAPFSDVAPLLLAALRLHERNPLAVRLLCSGLRDVAGLM